MTTTIWLIEYTYGATRRSVACLHNAIADYRRFAPDATVREIDIDAVIAAADTLGNFDALASVLEVGELQTLTRITRMQAVLREALGAQHTDNPQPDTTPEEST